MKVLIVEDDFSSRKILQKILSPYGECDIATDGQEAIKAFEQAIEDKLPYQLVCLDIKMPGLDGHKVLQQIRQFESQESNKGFNTQCAVVMTTGCEDPANFMQAVRNGCEAYVAKPINREDFLRVLNSIGLVSI